MRRATTLTALVIGAALLAPTGTATAVGETCRGEAATIVGSGPPVVGTDGRDVIVTGTSNNISAGAGDDLICLPASPSNVTIDAGPGDDTVDGTAQTSRGAFILAILGEGADTFLGGGSDDVVLAGTGSGSVDPATSVDTAERDVIDTGDGFDVVYSGGDGLINDDVVRTGAGEDQVTWRGTMGTAGLLDAGADDDTIEARASGPRFGVDLGAQTFSRNGVREVSFSGFERLRAVPEPGLGLLEIVGSTGDDTVEVESPATVRATLGAGDDTLTMPGLKAGTRLDLGAGTDDLALSVPEGSVYFDMASGRLGVGGRFSGNGLVGAEDVFVAAKRATVLGTDRPNRLDVRGCVAVVEGRGGRDVIEHSRYRSEASGLLECSSQRTILRGGSGNDAIKGGTIGDRIYGEAGNDRIKPGPVEQGTNRVWGGPGNDVVIGGSGRDIVFGQAGNDRIIGGGASDRADGGTDRDRCRAEVERSCER